MTQKIPASPCSPEVGDALSAPFIPAWSSIDTVMLDMDGTLLDLHFDNYFWQKLVPATYGRKLGLSTDEASAILHEIHVRTQGTLEWYCLDFWSARLNLDIAGLKKEARHKIAIRPNVVNFLRNLRLAGKRLWLVTNAHPDSLSLKMQHTGIGEHFDRTTSSHQLKLAKENPGFWVSLKQVEHYDPARTLLIDDSIPVLRRAGQEGIGHLLSIHRPDSQRGPVARQEFHQVEDFQHIHCTDLRGELPAAVSKTSIDITSDDRPDYGTNYGTKKQR